MTDPSRLSARKAANAVANGELNVLTLVEACLTRIEASEPAVKAWAYVDPETALAQARACDARGPVAPLYGVPVGIKDIIDTADMPTQYGSPIYHGHRSTADADCVARVRTAGGIVLGKTITTEFAFRHPFGKTSNPHHHGHTPGGSSSGSAAAVADCMVPLAFGTQTGGSIIRPASYCGVYGYKPTFGTFDFTGIKALAPGLDTLGYFARDLNDVAWFGATLSNKLSADISVWPDIAPRVGIARMPDWKLAESSTIAAIETTASNLSSEGAVVTELTPAPAFTNLAELQKTIMEVEAMRALTQERANQPDKLSAELSGILERAAAIPPEQYDDAVMRANDCRARIDELFAENDVLLAASATGEAPTGLGYTGNPIFNGIWTLLHVPCLTLPFGRGPNGLPVGIQLVARRGQDDLLLSAAKWIAGRLALQ